MCGPIPHGSNGGRGRRSGSMDKTSRMDKILNITDRIASQRRQREIRAFRLRSQSVQRIVQCSSCNLKCAMCGQHTSTSESCPPSLPSTQDVRLCESCLAEFEDFVDAMRGRKGSGIFWHNREWKEVWSTWQEHQEAIKKFSSSPEYKRMIGEPEGSESP